MYEYIRDLEKMNDVLGLLFGVLMMLLIITLMMSPEELENGCISYNDSIYCEEVSK